MDKENQLAEICKLAHADHLEQLCDLAYHIMGNPVFVCDMAHTILGYTHCVEILDPHWQHNIVGAVLDKNTLVQEREVGAVHESSIGSQRPVLVNDDDAPYPRLIKTLVMRGIPVGVMVVTAYVRPLEEQDAELMELIASFIMPIIAKDRYFVSSNERTVENYFIKLLDGAKISSERVEKRLNLLEFNRTEYMYVLTICACQRSSQGNVPTIAQLIDRFRHLGCEEVFLYNAALVCVYRSDHDIVDWDNQEPGLTQILREEGLEAGVSRRIADLSDLREYYLQARNALSIGRRLGREATSYSRYDSLSAFLLFRNIPREELMNYCHQKIQRLAEYDDAHNMDLCVTLQVYLEQTKSLAKAADVLYIHRNTVRYRINKCMELMNTDLEDGNEIFAYILSLRIIEYQKKFPADGGEILDG